MVTGVLYITYDGLLDPLGQSQIIPYLKKLSRRGFRIIVLSFEKKGALKNASMLASVRLDLDENGILWKRIIYRNRPRLFGTLCNLMCGCALSLALAGKYDVKIAHCRGYIPSLMAIVVKKAFKAGFVFDMRGFWVEEKVDAGFWNKAGLAYKTAKALEKKVINSADEIVVLTEKAKKRLVSDYGASLVNIEVIPTCVDLERFRPREASDKGCPRDKIVVLYSGSTGTFYGFKELASFFRVFYEIKKQVFFLLLVNNGKEAAENLLKTCDLPDDSYNLLSLPHSQVPDWIRRADVSLIFYRRENSAAGCCPTKLAESLASGVPVIMNKDVGDCDEVIRGERVGFILEDFSDYEYRKVINEFLLSIDCRDRLRERCRDAARRLFSLDDGSGKYLNIYRKLNESIILGSLSHRRPK